MTNTYDLTSNPNTEKIKQKKIINFKNIKCYISINKYNKIRASKISFDAYISNKIIIYKLENIQFNLDHALELNLDKNISISVANNTYQDITELSKKLKLSKTKITSFIIEML